MQYSRVDFPELRPEHVSGAGLFANRREMLGSLELPRAGAIAEVGVAHGDFSEFLIERLKPAKFVAIDLFEMEKSPIHWGIPQEVMFKGMTHLEFYRQRMAPFGEVVSILQGLSRDCLAKLPNQSFDMIYVDAGHDYENVKRDSELAQQKIKRGGVIVFNDYVMYDPFTGTEYGVVQAVNELLAQGGWRVVGFALEKCLFCDIAIRRSNTGRDVDSGPF